MIELKNINKTFDDGFQALKDINLSFEEGKINVLIGPSGCGKTTTMKLLNRLVDYTKGEILIDGENIQDINPIALRRKMGFVIQNIGLFPHMTIYNNVATVPKLLNWDKQKIHSRVTELLEMVNLDPKTYMKRYPSELSGGQQQRIGVIRALAAEPSTILMDEPFSALDPISREQLQDELLRLQTEINKTIIFVTHDMDEAIKIADQIILMKDGSVVQKGSPQEILANPANDFVRDFIGEKRLGTDRKLPQLVQFISKEYIAISDDSTVKSAMEMMIAHQVAEAPVVKSDGRYVGLINLYDMLSNKNRNLHELIKKSSIVITEKDETESVLNNLDELHGCTPIINVDSTLVGILDKNKLLQVLKHVTEGQSGVA
ncbi:betaine/proline/choline family ABC transporter ATP-binding protein [Virgibacillus necropolis]|uniref:Quaternary amine transport ATP-binding protein n=1 Tax=Virgibacillus necropolis TaxID=163877 RepID=A0A221MFB7_9BACI|nr:betaine/proline/choline family ABC transporter ATP-binding protein [Virgibacillus necropolis]ASN06312.1 glycine/betaine ABC transporter ATP-binding protein [Virgibacillus necropolis]